jgi:hypothetical protein
MSESEGKPEADFEETDAVVLDEEGKPRVRMETLQKSGDSDEDE